mmetsp:Transcript_15483/g.29870  ORF Transcript_15483/g.29870 Transcript_15483/m.29870 type:complete len:176 (-) Transcript_15483:689-1216(-)
MGVGKLLELAVKRSAGGAAREVQERISAAASGRGTRVNWEDYNYPPYIRVVHYDDNDIEVPGQRAAVKWAHVCYILTTTSLLLNVAANIVLLCAGATDFVNCVYAFFNLVIVAVVGMYGFYHGYKVRSSVAASDVVHAVLSDSKCTCSVFGLHCLHDLMSNITSCYSRMNVSKLW